MASAFAAAHTKRKSDRLDHNKQGIKRLQSQASNVSLLKQISNDAHARDFSPKEWQKNTKNLTGASLFDALWPPVPGYPCEKAMKLSSMNKLVSKIYEQLCSEYEPRNTPAHTTYARRQTEGQRHRAWTTMHISTGPAADAAVYFLILLFFVLLRLGRFYAGAERASRVEERTRPPLVRYVEDSLLLQYGMPSLARKTLLQMVATCHKHHEGQARCRTFAELSGIMPPRWKMVALCPDQAQDFYFRFLTNIYPSARKGTSASRAPDLLVVAMARQRRKRAPVAIYPSLWRSATHDDVLTMQRVVLPVCACQRLCVLVWIGQAS
jgi:hypothetical protein